MIGQAAITEQLGRRGAMVMVASWPQCKKCGEGDLVPLSDYGTDGATVTFKAWVCTNPHCGFNLKIHKGNLFMNEPVHERSNNAPSN